MVKSHKVGKKLYWVLTDSCNLNCKYCYYLSGLAQKTLSFPKVTYSLLDKLTNNFQEIILTGGEPTLHPQFFQIVAFLKNKNVKVGLLTNGVILDKKKVKKLISLKIDEVSVSLDSLDPKINDSLRGQTEKTLKAIKELIRLHPQNLKLEIMQTITSQNIDSIAPMIDFCLKNKITLWLDPVDISKDNPLSLLNLDKKQLRKLKWAFSYWNKKFASFTTENYSKNVFALIKKQKPKKCFCPMGTESFVLDVDFNLYPCFLRKDINLGKITNSDIGKLLKSAIKKTKILQKAPCVRLGCVCMTISNLL